MPDLTPHEREQVRVLFEGLAELPAAEREAALRDGAVPAAVRAELAALFGQSVHEAFGEERLGQLSEELAGKLDADGRPEAIGPYEIVELLGEGGMGEVYLAEQREPVQRRVALKVIKLGMGSREVLARFELERQALAVMSHESIARVFDGGVTAQGQPYFVMEYVEGGVAVAEFCAEHELSVQERVELVVQVCEGVQHAHQRGVLHRDLKPGNILATMSHGRPRVKIIDFGLARTMGEGDGPGEPTLLTRQGQLLGTPEYMAPEQARGDAAAIDTRTDVYAIGVILYELLTGVRPYSLAEGETTVVALQRLHEQTPQRPSARLARPRAARGGSASRLHRLVRGDLDAITLKALEVDPQRRYEGCGELRRDLERYLRHEPVQAQPPSQLYRLRKLVRRHRLQFAAAGMIFATVLVGAIVATAFAVEATAQKNEAESSLARWTRLADRRRLEQLSEEAAGLWPATPERLPALRDWLARAQVLAARLDGHRAALRQLRAQAIDDPPATQAADRAFYWAEHLRLEEIAHAIQLVDAEGRAALQRERETLEATVAKRHTWLFASNDLAFRHGQLQELVADLELFATAERSELLATVPDVTQRRAQAEQLRADAQRPESVAAWDALRADVARPDSPYRGLDVVAAPIPGLVPLGVDRDSGLWELYHTRSGAAPTWDGEPLGRGRVVLSATSDEGIVLVLLPGGSFRMGAEAAGPERGADQPNVDAGAVSWERPVHEVTLDPFLIGKYEVTRGQWERLFGPPSYNDAHEIFWRTTPRHPIADVTWRACDEAARRWDLILPTEAQWEYACRAGTTTAWFTGNASRTLRRFANVGDTNAARPVGELRPNAFGLHDVHGNVAEWCRDELVTYELPTRAGDGFRGAWTDPPRRKGALRGGFAGVPLQFSRSATRGEHDAASPTTAVGVRVARPLRHRSR